MNPYFALILPSISLLAAASLFAQNPDQPAQPATLQPILDKDYSYSYWQNSWRKREGESFKDILCFETGHFGLALDIHNLKNLRLGPIADESSILQTLQSRLERL